MSANEPSRPDLRVAFTLCTRLCHDLAGTAGALAGTLEMAMADADTEALALAADCARELSARLRLLRVAWGPLGDQAPIASLVAGLPGADRLQVDLGGLAALDDASHRLAVNLLLLAAQSLPRGGTIRLSGDKHCLSVWIEGPRAAWPSSLGRCLDNPAELAAAEDSPRDVGVAIACLLAHEQDASIALTSPTRLTVVAHSERHP